MLRIALIGDGELPERVRLAPLAVRAEAIAAASHAWIAQHALFPASIEIYLQRLEALRQSRR